MAKRKGIDRAGVRASVNEQKVTTRRGKSLRPAAAPKPAPKPTVDVVVTRRDAEGNDIVIPVTITEFSDEVMDAMMGASGPGSFPFAGVVQGPRISMRGPNPQQIPRRPEPRTPTPVSEWAMHIRTFLDTLAEEASWVDLRMQVEQEDIPVRFSGMQRDERLSISRTNTIHMNMSINVPGDPIRYMGRVMVGVMAAIMRQTGYPFHAARELQDLHYTGEMEVVLLHDEVYMTVQGYRGNRLVNRLLNQRGEVIREIDATEPRTTLTALANLERRRRY